MKRLFGVARSLPDHPRLGLLLLLGWPPWTLMLRLLLLLLDLAKVTVDRLL
jgi:hypothetical protein